MRNESTTVAGLPRGRPRDPGIDATVLRAAIALLREGGYAACTFASVAERAGANKPSIYRRWPSRQALVIDALAHELAPVVDPDTGCTRCDFGEAFAMFAESFGRALPAQVLAPLVADCASDPELHEQFMAALFLPLRRVADQILVRAIERGDVRADLDLDLAVDLLSSTVYYRALFLHAPLTPSLLEDAADLVLQGVATDYEHLMALSREHRHSHRTQI
jgi:AcrR family transcriptional regulator